MAPHACETKETMHTLSRTRRCDIDVLFSAALEVTSAPPMVSAARCSCAYERGERKQWERSDEERVLGHFGPRRSRCAFGLPSRCATAMRSTVPALTAEAPRVSRPRVFKTDEASAMLPQPRMADTVRCRQCPYVLGALVGCLAQGSGDGGVVNQLKGRSALGITRIGAGALCQEHLERKVGEMRRRTGPGMGRARTGPGPRCARTGAGPSPRASSLLPVLLQCQ